MRQIGSHPVVAYDQLFRTVIVTLISFAKLGNYGRLGNQLFQYAFLRATAERLKTSFYCPKWDGDEIFDLRDGNVRAEIPIGIEKKYDPAPEGGFCAAALEVCDGTEIQGFFQSEKYFSGIEHVRSWFSFRPAIIQSVMPHFSPSYLNEAVSISLRLDADYANTREFFPLYGPRFYDSALARLEASGPVLVFSDRPDLAKQFVGRMRKYEYQFVEGLNSYEQLYLMTQCSSNVITNSTFAWWGAWLNQRGGHLVVAPSAWCRPGVPNGITDILCESWIKVRGTVPLWDHFQIWRIRHLRDTFRRYLSRRR